MKRFLRTICALVLLGGSHVAAADEMGGAMAAMPGMTMSATPIDTAPTAPNAININNFSFAPKVLTVAAGTKITWINKDEEPHTVTNAGSPPAFKSAALDSGDSFSVTFTRPGTYQYFCSIHPFMRGTVVVQ